MKGFCFLHIILEGYSHWTVMSFTIFPHSNSSQPKSQTTGETCIFPPLLFTYLAFALQRKTLLQFLSFWQKARQGLLARRLWSLPTIVTERNLAAARSSPAGCQWSACAGTSGRALRRWVCSGTGAPTCSTVPYNKASRAHCPDSEACLENGLESQLQLCHLSVHTALCYSSCSKPWKLGFSVLIFKRALAVWGKRPKTTENCLYRKT